VVVIEVGVLGLWGFGAKSDYGRLVRGAEDEPRARIEEYIAAGMYESDRSVAGKTSDFRDQISDVRVRAGAFSSWFYAPLIWNLKSVI
jgi:hypothetical protein